LLLIALLLIFRPKNPGAPASGPTTAGRPAPDAAAAPESPVRHSRANPREADKLLAAEGAKTDVTLSTFPSKEYQHLPTPGGKAQGAPAGEAYMHVPSARRRIAMDANRIGEFPAVETKLNDIVGVRLSLAVKPGTPVRVVIMDGGSFPAVQGVAQVLKATNWGGIAFEFTTSGNIGFHRVLVQAQGHPSRILNFNATDGDTWPARSTASAN
jgi:hypothetical protein